MTPGDSDDGPDAAKRRHLIEAIEREVELHGDGQGGRRLDPTVRAALMRVPRERFVPPALAEHAYDNRPLAIGHGQTISQPLIVALMTHLLRLQPDARVLEIGTGSGYQAAVLAELAAAVVTYEIVAPLAVQARTVLDQLGYRNITFHTGDGTVPPPDDPGFDGILVTAAGRTVPASLVAQLRPGGRMVIPVGPDPLGQILILIERDQGGRVHEHQLFPVAFVPLTRRADRT